MSLFEAIIPDVLCDSDETIWIKLYPFCQKIGVDRSFLTKKLREGYMVGQKDSNGIWFIRMTSALKFIKNYRYGALKTANGRWWDKDSLLKLYSGQDHGVVAERINKSYGAVKTMRSKLGINQISDKFIKPYFVSPHAMLRYRQRILNIPDKYLMAVSLLGYCDNSLSLILS